MKKFTFALVAAAFAVCANAATINWVAQKGYLYDGAGDNAAKITSGTAYLVSTGFTQAEVVSLFITSGGDTSATLTELQKNPSPVLGTGSVGDNARISDGTGTTSATDTATAYFVVFNGGKMFVSATADSVYDGLAQNHELAFASISTASKATTKVGTGDSFGGAGWYEYKAVPEPTTVALLALGLAAVGLKRKLA